MDALNIGLFNIFPLKDRNIEDASASNINILRQYFPNNIEKPLFLVLLSAFAGLEEVTRKK